MTDVDVTTISITEITRKILDVLLILEPLSPAEIRRACETALDNLEDDKPQGTSSKLLLNTYFNQALGFNCGIEKVAEQEGKKKLPANTDYDLIFHITVHTNAIQTITLRLLAPLSVRNFLNFQSATKRPKPPISNEEVQAFQAAAVLNGEVLSTYRKRLVLRALIADIDFDELQSRSKELHELGIYTGEVESFLLAQ